MINGPRHPDETDGPEALYVILVDNGRSAIFGTDYAEILGCIRCGACINACPIYEATGGHAYGWVYPGPVGAVLTPLLTDLKEASPLPHASSLCGKCKEVCPVDIDLPRMLLDLRRDLVNAGHTPWLWAAGMRAWSRAAALRRACSTRAAHAARIGQRALPDGPQAAAGAARRPLDGLPRSAPDRRAAIPGVRGGAKESAGPRFDSRDTIWGGCEPSPRLTLASPRADDLLPVAPLDGGDRAALVEAVRSPGRGAEQPRVPLRRRGRGAGNHPANCRA